MPHRTGDAEDHDPHGGDTVLSPWGTVRAASPRGNGGCQGPCGMGHAPSGDTGHRELCRCGRRDAKSRVPWGDGDAPKVAPSEMGDTEGSVPMGGGCQGLRCCRGTGDAKDRVPTSWGTLKALSPGTGGPQGPYPTVVGGGPTDISFSRR